MTFLYKVGPFFFNIRGWTSIRFDFLGNLLEKLTFSASELGDGPLIERGPLLEFLLYLFLL